MLRARLRGRTRRSGRTSFNSSLGGCACSRFLRERWVWQVLSSLERSAGLGPWPNVCEGNPATRKAIPARRECSPLPPRSVRLSAMKRGGGRATELRLCVLCPAYSYRVYLAPSSIRHPDSVVLYTFFVT